MLFFIFILILYTIYIKKSILNPLNKQVLIQNSFIETLIKNAPIPIFYKDTKGKYLGCNIKFEEFLGVSRDELILKGVFDITSSDIANRYYETDLELINNPNQTQIYEFVVENRRTKIKKDVIFYKNAYFNENGEVEGIIGAIMDITEKKESEKKLKEYSKNLEKIVAEEIQKRKAREKQALEHSKLAQMGEMISMIAHQWRQPLGTIASAVINIQNKIKMQKFDLNKKEDREALESFLVLKLEKISDYVQFLSNTIDDFRTFFKENKEKEMITLDIPIKKAVSIIETSLKNKNITLQIEYKKLLNVNIHINEVVQVVLNILKNAEDNFIEKDTKNAKISITVDTQNYNPTIIISDNGGGIKEENLLKIFEPYYSTKLKKNGTGIGLYMSKIIIEEHHNGKIEAFNENNQAFFKITFFI